MSVFTQGIHAKELTDKLGIGTIISVPSFQATQ